MLLIFINLSNILESEVKKRLPQFLNQDAVEFTIQKIGFSSTYISTISVGKSISVDSVNIDYDVKLKSFPGLKYSEASKVQSNVKLNIQKVTISGIEIHADLDNENQIKIRGLDFLSTLPEKGHQLSSGASTVSSAGSPKESSGRSQKHQTRKEDLSKQSPLFFQSLQIFKELLPSKLIVKNSKIILHTPDHKSKKELIIPFDLLSFIKHNDIIKDKDKTEVDVKSKINTSTKANNESNTATNIKNINKIKTQKELISVGTRLYLFGETVNGFVTYDINQGVKSIQIQGKSFDAGHLNQFVSIFNDQVHLNGLLNFNFESSSPLKEWNMDFSNIGLIQPVKAQIQNIKAKVLIDKNKITTNGFIKISSSLLPEIGLDFGLDYDLDLNLENGNQFNLKIETQKMNEFKILYDSNLITVTKPEIQADFKGILGKISGGIFINCKSANIQNKNGIADFVDLKIVSSIVTGIVRSTDTNIDTSIDKDLNRNNNKISSKFTLSTNTINMRAGLNDSSSVTAKFTNSDITGKIILKNNKLSSGNMIVKLNDGTINSLEYKTKASGINIKIPVSYPAPINKSYGSYSISSILYDNQYDFSMSGEISQASEKASNSKINDRLNLKSNLKFNPEFIPKFNPEFIIGGNVAFNLFPDIKTQFDSIVGFDKNGFKSSCEIKTDTFTLNDSDIKKLNLKNISLPEFDFTALIKGKAEYANNKFKSSMKLKIQDGKFFMPDASITAKGINTSLEFDDLLSLNSIPGQVIIISSMEKGKIKIDDARIRFTVEQGKFLLVENIKFQWCNGLVSTESVRFPHKNNEYYLSLYCDRLELTQLLEQMGAFSAKGSGTLNGRIPVKYFDGKISFDNGFLFSTPGSGGTIMIENSDKIISGIPMDTPQFSQLDLAQEALKNFNYKWAKLKFHTKKDTLFVDMELDGEPSNILPFVYSKDFGGFVRVDAANPGSHFQGIKLDVNLKLPFNEVIKSGNKIKSIFN